MKETSYDVIVAGGGTAGFAAAVSAAREGAKTLVIEEMGHLGGTPVSTYVTPMMKTILPDGTNLTGGLYLEVLDRMKRYGYAETFPDGNPGWFSPEMMKFVLDEFLEESGADVLFHTSVIGTKYQDKALTHVTVHNVSGINDIEAKYVVDGTSNATVAAYSGVPFVLGENNQHQAMSHRFVMAGVDLKTFSDWLAVKDPNKNVSPIYITLTGDILLTTAYTAENKDWALTDLFEDAIKKNILKPEDAAYFQLFTVPGQRNSAFFNCPRIYAEKGLSPLSAEDISYAQRMGRKQILRVANFCKHYFPGFEDAYISNIAQNVGVRDSRRIKGRYTLTVDDIVQARKFPQAVARSNYPVDVHASGYKGDDIKLKDNDYYEIPLECLQTNEFENLLVVGKTISAEFYAQSSLRIQPTCWSMGEYAGKFAAKELKKVTV